MSFFVGVCSPQILRRSLQIMEASFFHLQGGLSWHQKQKSWSCTGFVNWTASCWPSKTFSMSTLARKMLHSLGADNCMALENALCRRCWPGTRLLLWVYSLVEQEPMLGPGWSRERGTGDIIPLLDWVCTMCSCAESCWEDLLPWRSFRQPDKLHCPGCEERFRIYEHSLKPNETYLFCAVLFVKMTSFFMLINKGILTAPWTENATLWVLRR